MIKKNTIFWLTELQYRRGRVGRGEQPPSGLQTPSHTHLVTRTHEGAVSTLFNVINMNTDGTTEEPTDGQTIFQNRQSAIQNGCTSD